MNLDINAMENKRFNLFIEIELLDGLKRKAESRGMKVSAYIRNILWEDLKGPRGIECIQDTLIKNEEFINKIAEKISSK